MSIRDTQILDDCWIGNRSMRPNICGSLRCNFLQYYPSGIEFWGRLWVFGKFVDACFKHPLRNEIFSIKFIDIREVMGARGGVVVKALRYKPVGRGFDSRWCHWNFSVT